MAMRFRKSDIFFSVLTLAMFFLGSIFFRFSFHDPRSGPMIAIAMVSILLATASLALLPIWLVVHVIRNRGRTAGHFLLLEAGLLLCWLGTGIYFWTRTG